MIAAYLDHTGVLQTWDGPDAVMPGRRMDLADPGVLHPRLFFEIHDRYLLHLLVGKRDTVTCLVCVRGLEICHLQWQVVLGNAERGQEGFCPSPRTNDQGPGGEGLACRRRHADDVSGFHVCHFGPVHDLPSVCDDPLLQTSIDFIFLSSDNDSLRIVTQKRHSRWRVCKLREDTHAQRDKRPVRHYDVSVLGDHPRVKGVVAKAEVFVRRVELLLRVGSRVWQVGAVGLPRFDRVADPSRVVLVRRVE